jgi:drug/metabolite transporter (DMT)-like permease
MDSSGGRARPVADAPGSRRPAPRHAALALLFVVFAWGISWPVNKLLIQSVPPLWMAAIRSGLSMVAVFAIVAATGRLVLPKRGDWPVLTSIALLHMVGFVVATSIGLLFVPAGRTVVLAYTTPLWVTPGAALFLGERLTPRRLLGVALGVAGLLVLFNPLAFDWGDRDGVLGNALILLAAFFWAASILHIRGHRWVSSPFELVPWEMVLATLILVPLAALTPLPAIEWTPQLWLLLLYAAVPGGGLAYWAAATASRGLPAATTSLGLLGAPVVGLIASTLWLGEAPSVALAVAVVLILGGVTVGSTGK